MPKDPVTGLPVEFIRMLAVKVNPFGITRPVSNPNHRLDAFFDALRRSQIPPRNAEIAAGERDPGIPKKG